MTREEWENHPLNRPTLDRVAENIRTWQRGVFATCTPHSAAAHLLKEAHELVKAPRDPEEMADVFLLLVAVADCAGVDLAQAAQAKLEKNKTRKWGPPNADGVREHVREG